MAADIITLCDRLANDFQNRITNAGVMDTIVTREYDITHDLSIVNGRKVHIFPLSYNPIEDVDRESERYEFTVGFVILERYRLKTAIPNDWIDERVAFVQDHIFTPLDNQEPFILEIGDEKYWVEDTKVTSVYDYKTLTQNRAFWSEVEAKFHRIATNL